MIRTRSASSTSMALSIRNRHASECATGFEFVLAASHPGHDCEYPYFRSSISRRMYVRLLLGGATSTGGGRAACGITAGISTRIWTGTSINASPGIGCHGAPRIESKAFRSIRSSLVILFTDLHLYTPSGVATRSSWDLRISPTKMPFFHLSSNPLGFGPLRYITFSPKHGSESRKDFCFLRSYGVRPSGPRWPYARQAEACRTSHGRIGCSLEIFVPWSSSHANFKVRLFALMERTHSSMNPFAWCSATGLSSNMIVCPWFNRHSAAATRFNSRIAGSLSDLRMYFAWP